MTTPQDITRDATLRMLKAGIGCLWILWFLMSFAPLLGMMYGSATIPLWANILFVISSLLIILPTYGMIRWVSAPGAAELVDARFRQAIPMITLWAIAWMVLYAAAS